MLRVLLGWLSFLLLQFSLPAFAVEPPPALAPSPHIALLLPLKSSAFRAAADAVQQGFLAAASLNRGGLPVRIYPCNDEGAEVLALYTQAYQQGAALVVGPLTRNGVNVLAAQPMVPLPTLTLNTLEQPGSANLYGFGMNADHEARLAAQLAAERGLQQAVVITGSGQFALRMQMAFEEAWAEAGGGIQQEITFNNDVTALPRLNLARNNVIFLAMSAQQARLIRPYLPRKAQVYSTSQLFVSNAPTNFEFNGIRFVDMPWLLQPDAPLVQSFPHAVPPLPLDLERLYALGIDAYRLGQALLTRKQDGRFELDGVSGHIRLDGQQFLRSALPATFNQGQAQVWNVSLPDADSAPQP